MYRKLVMASGLSLKEEHERINQTLEYFGSWSRLKAIFAEVGLRGGWSKVGAAKVFTPKNWGTIYYWWPDSGDITKRSFTSSGALSETLDRIQASQPAEEGHRSGARWTPVLSKRLGTMSMPQLAILCPQWTCEENLGADFKSLKIPAWEHDEVLQ